MSMKWRIHDAIGSGSNNVLLKILPNLQKWMADGNVATENLNTSSSVKGIGSSHRLKFMFCKLIGAIACRAHPLILFLDDLQWADEMTVRCVWHFLNLRVDTIHVYLCFVLVSLKLDIIRMMMTDPDIRHFVSFGLTFHVLIWL